jgi:hypothetical protein
MIRLGYEIGSGRPVDIPADRHVAISGQTQRSGKTTTLEALIHRSGLRAVAFVTKRAEGSFRSARPIPPYFRDSADWQFVSSILEAMLGERMKFQRSWIIDACRDATGLAEVFANVRRDLHGEKNPAYAEWLATPKKQRRKKGPNEWARKPATGLNASVLTELEAYLEIVIPQIERLPYENKLRLEPGLNVMDLAEYSTELQQLVIRSVLEWVYERERNTVVIIPEAWEFIPQNRRSPVLLAAEELIRKGAAAGNYVWLDSQDIAGVHKNVLRSVGVWIVGVQREQNEVRRTLGCLPVALAPREKDAMAAVMTLGKGQFFAAYDQHVAKVYVQPFWISDAHAAAIARGDESVESAEKIWRERQRDSKAGRHAGPEIDGETERGHVSPDLPGGSPPVEPLAGGDDRIVSPSSPPQLLQIQESPETPQSCERCGGKLHDDPFYMHVCIPGPETEVQEGGAMPEVDYIMFGGRAWTVHEIEAISGNFSLIKERAEQLQGEVMRLRQEVARLSNILIDQGINSAPANGNGHAESVAIDSFTDAGYELLLKRLLSDQRALVALDAIRPELRVRVERPVIEMDDRTLKGRIARLASEGFFKSPRPAGEVLREAQRRGWMTSNNRSNHVAIPLSELTELGLLTREDQGYQLAPGCRITEAK